ncbi:hypothetical protein AB1Y20_007070 [Prymnesium parvum]|uniref:Uncharacterized protein n=1 Tax=Prymnesium parvum TaxID=97485 RepID=A0AB34J096_PRYPA
MLTDSVKSPLLPHECEAAASHVRSSCNPAHSLAYALMERLGLLSKLQRLLAWSPRLRQLKECSDRYPCLRAVMIVVYCTKSLIIAGLIMLLTSLRSPALPASLAANDTRAILLRPAVGAGAAIEPLRPISVARTRGEALRPGGVHGADTHEELLSRAHQRRYPQAKGSSAAAAKHEPKGSEREAVDGSPAEERKHAHGSTEGRHTRTGGDTRHERGANHERGPAAAHHADGVPLLERRSAEKHAARGIGVGPAERSTDLSRRGRATPDGHHARTDGVEQRNPGKREDANA